MKLRQKSFLLALIAMIAIFAMQLTAYADYPAKIGKPADGEFSGKTVILQSNDVHGQIDGYASIAELKKTYEAKGAEVILVDVGDFSQGDPYVSTSKGLNAITMMNAAGYNLVTLGNHEFDYGFAQLKQNLNGAQFKVLAANVLMNGSPAFDSSYIYTSKSGLKIGFFGLETPETLTKVNPALIQGITILGQSDLYACAQQQVNGLKESGADIIISLAHLGVDAESAIDGHRSIDMYAHTNGIDLVLDGHSNSVMTAGENGEPIMSTGTKFENIGVVVINDGEKRIEDCFLIPTETIAKDAVVDAKAHELMEIVDNQYDVVFARSEVTLEGAREANRARETNTGDFITDAMYWSVMRTPEILNVDANHVVSITNGGIIRAGILPGNITRKDLNTVLPFDNTLAVVYVSGQELLEALEASTFCVPELIGGYPQTRGIKFTVDATKPFDQGATYPNSTYHKPNSIRRVSIESINGQPFSPSDTYAVITNDFCSAGGDTYYALKAAENDFDTGIPLDETVMDYVTNALGGVIPAARYGNTRGDQNIILAQSIVTVEAQAANQEAAAAEQESSAAAQSTGADPGSVADPNAKAGLMNIAALPGSAGPENNANSSVPIITTARSTSSASNPDIAQGTSAEANASISTSSGEAPAVIYNTYTVKYNDTLSGIAKQFYGNPNKWPVIYDANKDKIRNPHLIYEGEVLVIPAA